jgi:hypothetical protein
MNRTFDTGKQRSRIGIVWLDCDDSAARWAGSGGETCKRALLGISVKFSVNDDRREKR